MNERQNKKLFCQLCTHMNTDTHTRMIMNWVRQSQIIDHHHYYIWSVCLFMKSIDLKRFSPMMMIWLIQMAWGENGFQKSSEKLFVCVCLCVRLVSVNGKNTLAHLGYDKTTIRTIDEKYCCAHKNLVGCFSSSSILLWFDKLWQLTTIKQQQQRELEMKLFEFLA